MHEIRGPILSWIMSYLKTRKQKVRAQSNNGYVMPDEITINIGVPRDSAIRNAYIIEPETSNTSNLCIIPGSLLFSKKKCFLDMS